MHPRKRRGRAFSLASKNPADLGYLLRRAGFGGTPADVQNFADKTLGGLISELVDYESVNDAFTPPPDAILSYGQKGNTYEELNGLTIWWLQRMLTTPRPLQEKMVLFWHGHFATAISKVRSTLLMYRQNQIFRDNALGRFDDLLSAVYKDPAMLIWLDGQRNIKTAPNENWGREVLELFALGHGNYTEDDVHANARAFTGWRVAADGTSQFIPRLHDTTTKTLLGQTGAWDGEDAVRIIAAHPATGPFLATRLWQFFASDQAPQAVIDNLAGVYYSSNHSIREMVRALLQSPQLYAPQARTGHIKSPTEFVVTTLRQLGVTGADLTQTPALLAFLGQQLFNPPNVGGWPGGVTWINASTMLGRFNFASSLTGDVNVKTSLVDAAAVLAASGAETDDVHQATTPGAVADTLVSYVADTLGIDMTRGTHHALMSYINGTSLDTQVLETKIRGLIHLALVSPEYQAS